MGRYGRAIYGTAKYGLDLWAEYNVEPMIASITVDPELSPTSSITDDLGVASYDRVQVSWIRPSGADRLVLMRSNLGYPTSPSDPFAATLLDGAPTSFTNTRIIGSLVGDPPQRLREAFLDRNVEEGREYFYAVWVYVAASDEWLLAGRTYTTTSTDHGIYQGLKNALPPYMWNQESTPADGVSVMPEDDDENYMSRWLQACAWELDQTLTKVDLLRKVWDPQYTPAILLDDAVSMYGLPVEPALGARAERALLANAAAITGDRGSLDATRLLIESLTGFAVSLEVGTNKICNTDESSFEGLTVAPGSQTVVSGTGRWYFNNATLTRVTGDPVDVGVKISRTPNSDDDYGSPVTRFGLRLDAIDVTKDITMVLGEHIRVTSLTSDTQYGIATTSWVHGLETGDVVNLTLDGGATSTPVSVLAVLDDFRVRLDVSATTKLQNQAQSLSSGYFWGGMIPVYQGVPVEPSNIYSLVGKFQTNNQMNITLVMHYWDAQGNLLHTETLSPTSAVPPAPEWTQVSLATGSPAGAEAVTLAITMTSTGAAQYMGVDSLMVKVGGTPFDSPLTYDSDTPYMGNIDYTYEDARLLTINIDVTKTPSNGPIPTSVSGDLAAVIESRLTDLLSQYLPVGTAFIINGLPT